jgi:YhcH/YjgK/YiaL family protein
VIFDRLEHAEWYAGLSPGVARALAFLRDTPLGILPLGRMSIDGDRIYATVAEYVTRAESPEGWEAHRQYLDVQSLITGQERVGVAPRAQLQEVVAYDPQRDIAFFSGSGLFFTLTPGTFVILAPHEAHQPGLQCDRPATVRKIVIKVAVAGWPR